MTWRDVLRTASLEGVEFRTRVATVTPGRKVAEFDLPFDSSGVASVDLGKAADEFEFEALFFGDDYHLDRNQFLEIFDSPGPYLLVHPYLQFNGYVSIRHGDISIEESNDRGGLAIVKIKCRRHRGPEKRVPGIAALPSRSQISKASTDLGSALNTALTSDFSTSGFQDFVADSSIAVLDDVLLALKDINGSIDAILAVPGHIASQIDQIASQLATLINTPQALWDSIDNAMALVGNAFQRLGLGEGTSDPQLVGGAAGVSGAPARARAGLSQAISRSGTVVDRPEPPDIGTPARQQERANRATLELVFRANLLRHLAVAAVTGTEYGSADEARYMGRQLSEAMRDILEGEVAGGELEGDARRALLDFRTTVRKTMNDIAGDLVEITTYTPGDALPSCVIAYELYGDAERAVEIEQRNAVSDPGMIPPRTELEVLAE